MRVHFRSALRVALLALAATPAAAQDRLWIRQLGASNAESIAAATADGAGGVYVAGATNGNLGAPNAGLMDAWLARYDSAGGRTWIRQFGSSANDWAYAAALDGAGGMYVGGLTQGDPGGPSAGSGDVWLARYDGSGNRLWICQFGTASNDTVSAAAPDGAGGVYVTGYTWGDLGGPSAGDSDAWLAHCDGAGNRTWIRQLGTSVADQLLAAATGAAGGVYVAGFTFGSLGGPYVGGSDAWLALYDAAGNQAWIRQLGTFFVDVVRAAAPDGTGGVYVGGYTADNLGGPNSGQEDAWLAHYDGAGNQAWICQLGTVLPDGLHAAAPDGSNGVYVSGYTHGNLGGTNPDPTGNSRDGWVAHFERSGSQDWIRQLGTGVHDYLNAAASDGVGGVYVAGATNGSLGGPYAGGGDAWLARYQARLRTYCTAGTTTNGCLPTISWAGTPSASATSGFAIAVSDVEGQQQGLLFYGVDSAGFAPLPWGASSSFMCIRSPLQRTSPQGSGGIQGQCTGSLALDWNSYRAANPTALGAPFAVGQHVYAQAWFRDPPSPKTTMLSDALDFVVQP